MKQDIASVIKTIKKKPLKANDEQILNAFVSEKMMVREYREAVMNEVNKHFGYDLADAYYIALEDSDIMFEYYEDRMNGYAGLLTLKRECSNGEDAKRRRAYDIAGEKHYKRELLTRGDGSVEVVLKPQYPRMQAKPAPRKPWYKRLFG